MWPSTYLGMPALPLEMIGRVVPCAANPSTVRRISEAPVPQLAPYASGAGSKSSTSLAISAEVTPIMVRPAVSKLMVPHQGISASLNASAAARNSSGAEIVSSHSTSTPPSFRASACSWNISTARAWLSSPTGSMISPVGPTEPATAILRSARSATLRPSSAPAMFSSRTRRCASCSFRRAAVPPKVLVRNRSLPASTDP